MKEFKPIRVIRKYTQSIYADPEYVFSLLCPVREQDWLDGWKCKVLHSETGFAEENGVYSTQHPGEDDTIWIITKRNTKKHEIEFIYFIPGIRVTRLNIKVKSTEQNNSTVHIQYIYTAISEEGNKNIETVCSKEEFVNKMEHWEQVMNYFIETGKKLKMK